MVTYACLFPAGPASSLLLRPGSTRNSISNMLSQVVLNLLLIISSAHRQARERALPQIVVYSAHAAACKAQLYRPRRHCTVAGCNCLERSGAPKDRETTALGPQSPEPQSCSRTDHHHGTPLTPPLELKAGSLVLLDLGLVPTPLPYSMIVAWHFSSVWVQEGTVGKAGSTGGVNGSNAGTKCSK